MSIFDTTFPTGVEFGEPGKSFSNRFTDSFTSTVTEHKTSAECLVKPFSTDDMKILLLEGINVSAVAVLEQQGYQIESHDSTLPEDQLIEKIKNVHAIGIRSRTRLSAKVLKHAKNLISIGCFCIGTNQVDLNYATNSGIAVFHSPFANSRSVAELALAEIVCLARQMCDMSAALHSGIWNPGRGNYWEVRGKTLGIVGYGHIGSQLSILAEAMGMKVLYYDILTIIPLGTAYQVPTLDELLKKSDFVSLHVPATPDTKHLLSHQQFAAMKKGAYVLNTSRGSVVDMVPLLENLKSGKLAGAALDVFPNEPIKNGTKEVISPKLRRWLSELSALPNVILTPHIGGATEESQTSTGAEVSTSIVRFLNEGYSIGAVNFPEVGLKPLDLEGTNIVRLLYVYRKSPDVLRRVNDALEFYNIEKQYADSCGDVAYLITDISSVRSSDIEEIYNRLKETSGRIAVRIIF
ncbi:phosphoglycerate dehydrogenase SER33 KNAG_0C04190 [Huiozyma naganishii CBS 8797]|uniref:Phosphoglycerate dehydrogenase n=1 Tax=Huiozyma naganishii (strain ATCC MYA-139 / BCRC 22969 / CBS 8797 / KCTC 17520 / NBRC 10181 / NCYC 3082 / Yp74L-3) TaxID=1071383 RepID=J7S645_HUIN7|nr:hypothetical protein KNAG_0C04190 [Kazachstania naganishii CBS 8797]CCK69521.1 hypothetical protein KNAG_0C04190 [Kazachstania naganishii CBS 8797]